MPRSRPYAIAAFVVSAVVAPRGAAQGKVLVVSQLPLPGAYSLVSVAAEAASSGDTVLVKSGSYGTTTKIVGKSLTIVADAGASVNVGSIQVRNLTADQRVVVRGVRAGVISDKNVGTVWLEDCDLASPLVVWDSASVVLVRCDAHAISTAPPYSDGGDAVFVANSKLHVFDSTLTAGPISVWGPGGAALNLSGGWCYVQGSLLTGGEGMAGVPGPFQPCVSGPGGPGLLLSGEVLAAYVLDCDVHGGKGGACPFKPPSPDGPAQQIDSGSVTALSGSSSSLIAASPVRVGQPITQTYSAAPGRWVIAGAALAASLGLDPPPPVGPLMLGPSPAVFALGPIPAIGSLVVAPVAQPLPAGWESAQVYLQPAFVDLAAASVQLGAPSTVVLLDPAF